MRDAAGTNRIVFVTSFLYARSHARRGHASATDDDAKDLFE